MLQNSSNLADADVEDQHLLLSDYVADIYDSEYLHGNEEINEITSFENSLVDWLDKNTSKKKQAIELGCGTGRISYKLATAYDKTYGYDFSKEMLKVAESKKDASNRDKISFYYLDVDKKYKEVTSIFSLLVACFGFGSFLSNLSSVLTHFIQHMEDEGLAYFSFYNKGTNAYDEKDITKTYGTSYSDKDLMKVSVKGKSFEIKINLYSIEEIKMILSKYNQIDLLLLRTLSKKQENYISDSSFDNLFNDKFTSNKYILLMIKKRGVFMQQSVSSIVNNVPEIIYNMLEANNLLKNLKHHSIVRTMDDVKEALPGVNAEEMLKSVLIQVSQTDSSPLQYILCGIPADKKLNLDKVANLLDLNKSKLKMVPAMDVKLVTGYEVGALTPLGIPENINILVDSSFKQKASLWCGVGTHEHSLKLSSEDLSLLTNCKFQILTDESYALSDSKYYATVSNFGAKSIANNSSNDEKDSYVINL